MDVGSIIKREGGTSFEGHPQKFSEKCQRLLRRAKGGGKCVGNSFHVTTEYLKVHFNNS